MKMRNSDEDSKFPWRMEIIVLRKVTSLMWTLIMIMIYVEDVPVSMYIGSDGSDEGDIVDRHLHDQLIGQ